MKVKLCGVKRPEDISYMNEFRPDYVGFVFAGTKRRITPQTAAHLAEKLNPKIQKVGVFVNEQPEQIAFAAKLAELDVIQLHGFETEADIQLLRDLLPGIKIWKAVHVRSEQSIKNAISLSADMLLLDSFSASEFGGTGLTANSSLIKKSGICRPYFLAGGLNQENVSEFVNELAPFGVDISSGVETDGIKDVKKIESIMKLLRDLP